ncbi:hypothetical protein AB0H03_21500 [Streptomyces sparsogenes]|uniref:hypothetical protein n=1 Tax=Streptomyces sparsogenes TaxID=67365 RepID=UPI0033E54E3C
MKGADAVFLMWPFHDAGPAPAVVDALTWHTGRVVFLSSGAVQEGVAPERQPHPVGRSHARVEQLIERSGLVWTHLRPSTFAADTLWWADQIRAGDVVRGAYGAVAMALLHEADIAAVAVRALTEDGHHRAAYALTGPEVLTQAEQVRVIGEVLGRPLSAQPVVRAVKKVVDAYATLRASLRAGNLGPPTSKRYRAAVGTPIGFRPEAAQPFDDRCLSWQYDARTVSIWTVAGRMRGIRFACSPDQLKTLTAHRKGESDLVCRGGKWFLISTCDLSEPEVYEPDDWIGVDRGIVNLATTSDGTNYGRSAPTRRWSSGRPATWSGPSSRSCWRSPPGPPKSPRHPPGVALSALPRSPFTRTGHTLRGRANELPAWEPAAGRGRGVTLERLGVNRSRGVTGGEHGTRHGDRGQVRVGQAARLRRNGRGVGRPGPRPAPGRRHQIRRP